MNHIARHAAASVLDHAAGSKLAAATAAVAGPDPGDPADSTKDNVEPRALGQRLLPRHGRDLSAKFPAGILADASCPLQAVPHGDRS